MNTTRRTRILVNEDAGTVLRMGRDRIAAIIEEAAQNAGSKIDLKLTDGATIAKELDELATSDRPERILIGGGDGTVNSSVSALAGTRAELGILPLGTLNMSARDLDVPLELGAAVESLLRSEAVPCDVGYLNGDPFLSHAITGLFPRMARFREKLRHAKGLGYRFRIVGAWIRSFLDYRMRTLHIDVEGKRWSYPVPFLIVSNNPIQESGKLFPTRESLDQGTLSVYIPRVHDRSQILVLWWRMLWGDWLRDSRLTIANGIRATVTSRRKTLSVMMDGEIRRYRLPLQFEIRPRSLQLLIPRKDTEG